MLLSLLDGEAQDIVSGEFILDNGVTAEPFARLPYCLAGDAHLLMAEHQLQIREQLPGKKYSAFVRDLRILNSSN